MQPVMQADFARIAAPSAAPGQAVKAKDAAANGFFGLLQAMTNGTAGEGASPAKASKDAQSGALQAGMALLMMLQALQAQPQSAEGEPQAAAGTGGVCAGAADPAAQLLPADLLGALLGAEGIDVQAAAAAEGMDDIVGILQQALQGKLVAATGATGAQDALADTDAAGLKALIERIAAAAAPMDGAAAKPAAGTAQAAAATPQATGSAQQDEMAATPQTDANIPQTDAKTPQTDQNAKQGTGETAPATDAGSPAAPEPGRAAAAPQDGDGADAAGREATETALPARAESAAMQPGTVQNARVAEAANTPVQAGSETTATQADILAQLVDKATAGIKDGKYHMDIQLRPENLGKVSVKVTMDAEGMVVKIHAQKEAAESAISSQVAQLEQALKDRGITVVRMEVQEHLQDGTDQPGNPNDPRRNRREYSRQADGDQEAGREPYLTLQDTIYGNTVEFRA